MRENRKIDRRHFMRYMAGLGSIIVFGPPLVFDRLARCEGLNASFYMLVGMLNHRESAVVVGREYLLRFKGNVNRLDLIRQITSGTILERSERAGINPLDLLSMLQRQVRLDFELGRTVEIDGWILSVTEAMLCALAALSPP